jgi:SWI/SNF-related matrix-associated actin-dependent regulator 1 of chromatin subfamily A
MFKSVIIDESHKCKSTKTQQAKYVEGICKGKQWIFELTGTPVVNNNTDLVQQLKILGRLDDFGGYNQFIGRYCDGPKQSSNLRELNYRLWCCCFFRREKQKVLTQLPEKTRQYITCDITNRKEYDDAEKDVLQYLRTYKKASDDKIARAMRGQIMVKMGILKAIAARGKIKAVSDFIHDIIDGGEKLILFAYLKEVVEALKKEFPDAVTVTGADNIAQKQTAVDRFQNDPECKLIILNYRSGGTGLTLTAASRVGFIEFPWTYSDCEQAEDRAHRNGQKNNVNCYYFLGDKTIDKYMYSVIQSKKDIANEVTGTTTQIEEDIVNITMNLFRDRL